MAIVAKDKAYSFRSSSRGLDAHWRGIDAAVVQFLESVGTCVEQQRALLTLGITIEPEWGAAAEYVVPQGGHSHCTYVFGSQGQQHAQGSMAARKAALPAAKRYQIPERVLWRAKWD